MRAGPILAMGTLYGPMAFSQGVSVWRFPFSIGELRISYFILAARKRVSRRKDVPRLPAGTPIAKDHEHVAEVDRPAAVEIAGHVSIFSIWIAPARDV